MNSKILGIDLGGTSTKFAIVTTTGEILDEWSLSTDCSESGSRIVPNLIASVQDYLRTHGVSLDDFVGIGMGSPGTVDSKEGTVIGAYNLNWSKKQLVKEQFEKAFALPFFIDNDANVAALGEQWQGAGHQAENMLFITLGTGIGGGLIVDGRLVHGATGAAGEIGHVTVIEDGYPCTCGKRGCLETVSSATGIVRSARELAVTFAGKSKLKEQIIAEKKIHAKKIFDYAKAGDPLADLVVDRCVHYLGMALGNAANLLNPSVIVLGGGVSKAGDFLTKKVEAKVRKFTFATISEETAVEQARLGNDAGVLGAASLVQHQLTKTI